MIPTIILNNPVFCNTLTTYVVEDLQYAGVGNQNIFGEGLLSGYNSFSRRGNILLPRNLHLSYLRNGRLILGRACHGRELPIRG